MNGYEQEREQRMAENKKRIEELGLQQTVADLAGTSSTPSQGRKRSRKQATPERVIRRSVRERKEVSYKEPEFELYGQGPRVVRRRLAVNVDDEEELARLRATITEAPEGPGSACKIRKPVDSGKGVRIQGGKVYDSKFGVTCHWCRQKTLENHVTCTSETCGAGKRLPVTFCQACLRNRHGEDANLAHASKCWVCPPCRKSCGPGCILCCNCGPCRKKAGLEPTHQVVKVARSAGFDNVHDYLVHLARPKESPEEILARKLQFPWGKWMIVGTRDAEVSDAEPSATAGSEAEEEEDEVTPEAVQQAEAVPARGGSSRGRKQGAGGELVQKNLTDVFKVGKPSAVSKLSKKSSESSKKQQQAGKAKDAKVDNEAEVEVVAIESSDAEAEEKVVEPANIPPVVAGLSRRQRIRMNLGLGAVPVSA